VRPLSRRPRVHPGGRRHRRRLRSRGGAPGVRQQVARHDPGGATGGGPLMAALRLLMIDNYDSFTYNLVQYLGELGAEVDVRRNDAVKIGRASCRERVWIEVVGV